MKGSGCRLAETAPADRSGGASVQHAPFDCTAAELAYGIKLTYDNLSVKPKSMQEMRRQDQNLSVLRNDPIVRRRGRPANNAAHSVPEQRMQLGRASCRERVCQYV